jgi:hypothetical protein
MLVLKTIGEIKTEKVRTDGKNSRNYYSIEVMDNSNPFAPTVKRVIWQNHNADGTCAWKGGDPEVVGKFVNKSIPAEIVSRNIEPQQVTIDGRDVTVTKFTTIVFAHETVESVFKAAGKVLLENSKLSSEVKKEEFIEA